MVSLQNISLPLKKPLSSCRVASFLLDPFVLPNPKSVGDVGRVLLRKKKKTKPGDAVGFKVISKVKSREKAIGTFTTSNRMHVLQKYADFHFVEQMCPQALFEI